MVLSFESVDEILKCNHILTKTLEEYFLVSLLTVLYELGLTFESVGEILKCDH